MQVGARWLECSEQSRGGRRTPACQEVVRALCQSQRLRFAGAASAPLLRHRSPCIQLACGGDQQLVFTCAAQPCAKMGELKKMLLPPLVLLRVVYGAVTLAMRQPEVERHLRDPQICPDK